MNITCALLLNPQDDQYGDIIGCLNRKNIEWTSCYPEPRDFHSNIHNYNLVLIHQTDLKFVRLQVNNNDLLCNAKTSKTVLFSGSANFLIPSINGNLLKIHRNDLRKNLKQFLEYTSRGAIEAIDLNILAYGITGCLRKFRDELLDHYLEYVRQTKEKPGSFDIGKWEGAKYFTECIQENGAVQMLIQYPTEDNYRAAQECMNNRILEWYNER